MALAITGYAGHNTYRRLDGSIGNTPRRISEALVEYEFELCGGDLTTAARDALGPHLQGSHVVIDLQVMEDFQRERPACMRVDDFLDVRGATRVGTTIYCKFQKTEVLDLTVMHDPSREDDLFILEDRNGDRVAFRAFPPSRRESRGR